MSLHDGMIRNWVRVMTAAAWIGAAGIGCGQHILVETEAFEEPGGWLLDTQFIETMGSPYRIAHGLGTPVADAVTKVELAEDGKYKVLVRTINWTKRLGLEGVAGRFLVKVDGKQLGGELGGGEARWHWADAGSVELKAGSHELRLCDQSGFDGRVDAVVLTRKLDVELPDDSGPLPAWRRKLLGLPEEPIDCGPYDLVVIGGGYGGLGSAVSAARMGCKVAFIQNRPVLGGNGSPEIRVHSAGVYAPSEYKLSEIIQEFQDEAGNADTEASYVHHKKVDTVKAEKNIDLFLNTHAFKVEKDGDKIAAVLALNTLTNEVRRFAGEQFADCTGHGFIGLWSGADTSMKDKGRMGMSNMWRWENGDEASTFREEPWMLKLGEKDFPFPRDYRAEWFWESGFDSHPIDELETTRDWNLVAGFSAWNAMKNRGAFAERDEKKKSYGNAKMTWMAHIGGTRETLQILGDVVLTEEDVVGKKEWPDHSVRCTWSIDLHYPREEYVHANPGHPFISRAVHGKGVDRKVGYPIPYRCFYSRNIPNLFMAGRNISVTHEALGTVRVQQTIGMMGVVVGRAAGICNALDCSPRDVYYKHLEGLKQLMRLPGKARFETPEELRKALPPAK